ncbi:MAG TPA: DUF2279 domain-containing protein [Puia sp.]|uniref:DUF2279 domain-containing protein n=1 Tax=Puia sp. TaxID=2045100 RepID=UPI002CA69FD2|nr:DUF2279 domain-containing protein [Puia sp.]HVU96722.1 DUF2279 domain-containing protein [Puia sp.]
MQLKKYCLSVALSLLVLSSARAQDFFKRSPTYNPGRVNSTIIVESAIGVAVTIGLNYLWYKKFPHGKFHYFNDNGEWLQVDKVGHAATAYNIAAIQTDLLRWGGVRPGTAALIGTATALSFLSMIEIMDGHSAHWGFSKGDMFANMAGCLLFEGQHLMWGEQRISLKFSYHGTIFPKYYPAELGANLPQRMLKDYNGQSYWLSFNIASFLPASSNFPRWLNVSAGYGAEGMIGAFKNPTEVNGRTIPEFRRYRQWYLSFDTDLYRIDGLSPLTSTLLEVNRTFKTPAPALEWNAVKGLQFHPFYY